MGSKALPGGRSGDEALLYVGDLVDQSGNCSPGALHAGIVRLTQQAYLLFEQFRRLVLLPFCQECLRVQVASNGKRDGEVEEVRGKMLRTSSRKVWASMGFAHRWNRKLE